MKHNVENGTLTIFMEGVVNSFNAEEVEKEIDAIMSESSFERVVLDLEKTSYLSSAGLRIIVRIKQQYDDTSIIKTPQAVYDIFEMVGFQNMMKIEKL